MSEATASFGLPQNNILILDGGLGTTLEDDLSQPISDSPLWSAKVIEKSPQALINAHLSFLRAGADIISTATYQCCLSSFHMAGNSPEQAINVMWEAVRLADSARQLYLQEVGSACRPIYIALSMGPYGSSLLPGQEYTGFYPPPYGPQDMFVGDPATCTNAFARENTRAKQHSENALCHFHYDRLNIYRSEPRIWNLVDFIAFETIPLLREARAIKRAMSFLENNVISQPPKPWWLSFVFPLGKFPEEYEPGGRKYSVVEVMQEMICEPLPPHGIGINCVEPQFLQQLVEEITGSVDNAKLKRVWLVMYPNGGLEYNTGTRTWSEPSTPGLTQTVIREWGRELQVLLESKHSAWAGIIVGGCCKCGPQYIKYLKEIVDSMAELV